MEIFQGNQFLFSSQIKHEVTFKNSMFGVQIQIRNA